MDGQLQQFIDAIGALAPRIPIDVDLWSTRKIAAYLKRSNAATREVIACAKMHQER